MFLRRRTQVRPSSDQRMDDVERLLPTIELYEYPTDAYTNASLRICNTSESDVFSPWEDLHACPHGSLLRDSFRRIAASLKFDSCLDALRRRLQQRSRSQRNILHHGEDLECHDWAGPSSNARPKRGEREGRSWKAELGSGSDHGLRSSFAWYFWSPADTAKNCPTLEFLCVRLAPSNMWL